MVITDESMGVFRRFSIIGGTRPGCQFSSLLCLYASLVTMSLFAKELCYDNLTRVDQSLNRWTHTIHNITTRSVVDTDHQYSLGIGCLHFTGQYTVEPGIEYKSSISECPSFQTKQRRPMTCVIRLL